jgi:hypothetical protein
MDTPGTHGEGKYTFSAMSTSVGQLRFDFDLALGAGAGEQTLQPAAEVKQRSGHYGADTLKHQKPRTWVDVSVSLSLKRAKDRNKQE